MTPHLAADLAVTLEDDRPGMLAKAIGCVSAAGINIDGYTEMSGVVHVLTDNVREDCVVRIWELINPLGPERNGKAN